MEFSARQLLDLVSPVNFIATNPEVLDATLREHGANLVRGAANLIEDNLRRLTGQGEAGAERFRPGVEVTATPGRVVLRNAIMELIQYAPAAGAATVRPEPMLIVPAWIMKYYILDLSPHNSLVRYLVEAGHTVFMISWHNPTEADRERGMDDYVLDGVGAALRYIRAAYPGTPIDTAGYCLGGTLLAIALADDQPGEGEAPVNSLTLLAAQTDFSEAGELMLFIDESQIDWLEDKLGEDDRVGTGLPGQPPDGRRLPVAELARSGVVERGQPVPAGTARADERLDGLERRQHAPVATTSDHVSPWRSVHKLHLLNGFDLDFVLTTGGHNAGIVSEPGHKNRRYFHAQRRSGARYVDPDRWLEQAAAHDGSWWPAWRTWLESLSAAAAVPARPVPDGLGPAPGNYVLER